MSAETVPYFRPKRLKNHILWGRTYLYIPIREYPPLPLPSVLGGMDLYFVFANIMHLTYHILFDASKIQLASDIPRTEAFN